MLKSKLKKRSMLPPVRTRVDIDPAGAWIHSLHILDQRNDRALTIPKSEWHHWERFSEILGETLVHRVHKVTRAVILRETDPDSE